MARRIVRDLKKSTVNKPILLQEKREKRRTPILSKKVDLRKTSVENIQPAKYDTWKRVTKERPKRYLFSPRNLDLIRFGLIALLFIVLINAARVVESGKEIKNETVSTALAGVEQLVEGGAKISASSYDTAYASFQTAMNHFEEVQHELWFLEQHQDNIFTAPHAGASIQALLEAGKHLAKAGTFFSESFSALSNLPLQIMQGPNTADSESLTDAIKTETYNLNTALIELLEARKQLLNVDPLFLPSAYKEKFHLIQDKLNLIIGTVEQTKAYLPTILKLLGDRYPHRYLILFQNNGELRPTGGFIGSLMILDINDGHITKMDVHDVYEYDGQLHDKIEAPEEIQQLTDTWRLRDANYSPDFSISAEKVAWFLEQENGPTVDTVVAIDQSIILELLKVTGPVIIPSLPEPVTAENFNVIISYIIESKINPEAPKTILKELTETLFAKLQDHELLAPLLDLLITAKREKHLQAYSRDPDIQALFEELQMEGAVYAPAKHEDYLQVINISVSGNKSDRLIHEKLFHNTLLSKDGRLLNQLTIQKRHLWNPLMTERWRETVGKFGFDEISGAVEEVLGKGTNRSAVKVYVPKGSILEDVSGVPVKDVQVRYDEELDKTYFFAEMVTEPQNISEITFTYYLPFRLSFDPVDTYQLTIQKQPGTEGVDLHKSIIGDYRLVNHKNYPGTFSTKDRILEFETSLRTDTTLVSIWAEQ